jgi:glycosyltransferase involved in cell wall biosynthesis
MLILTNFDRFPERWKTTSGVSGQAIIVKSAWDFLRLSRKSDLVLVNCDVSLTYKLSLLYFLLPFIRRPLVVNDVVLRRPRHWRSRLTAGIKRFLLSRVDHFSVHFKSFDGLVTYFGISALRISYIPFKANIRYRYPYKVDPEGEYILCFGRSERDYDTFFAAMSKLPDLPAAIPQPDFAGFAVHSSRFTWPLDALPPNVRLLEDDGSPEALIGITEKARLVVLPILSARICPSGIGTYLNSMLMGKCVIVSAGPGSSDVLTGEALLVPPENPGALAEMIRRAWDDNGLRLRVAAAGRKYAEACGGEPELFQRVLDRAVEVVTGGRGAKA